MCCSMSFHLLRQRSIHLEPISSYQLAKRALLPALSAAESVHVAIQHQALQTEGTIGP